MPTYQVETPQRCYAAIVERGVIGQAAEYIPPKTGKVFVVTTEDVWRHAGMQLAAGLAGVSYDVLNLPGGEDQKRLAPLEQLAEQMVQRGGDRSSMVIAYGGGIVNDMGGFLAAIFMRGIPVLQIPTTLLAQVDAAIGGKTGVNLVSGKNLIGSFHQPLAVLTDPAILDTLPEREYRAGLYEIIKAGIIREPELFPYLAESRDDVLARKPAAVDHIIAESVRMKAEVVSSDEREGDMRRILNFGHTFGHALEAETEYKVFLHGEAVAWGMRAAVYLAESTGYLSAEDTVEILEMIADYGPIPPLTASPRRICSRAWYTIRRPCRARCISCCPCASARLRWCRESRISWCWTPSGSRSYERHHAAGSRATNRRRRAGCAACSAAWRTATISPITCSPSISIATGAPTPCAARGRFSAVPRRASSISAAAPATWCWPWPNSGRPVLGSDFCHPMLVAAHEKIARRHAPAVLFESDALGPPVARCVARPADRRFRIPQSGELRIRPARNAARAAPRRHGGDPGILAAAECAFGALYHLYSPPHSSVDRRPDLRFARCLHLPAGVGPQVSRRSRAWPP